MSRETIGKIERGVAAPLFETAEVKSAAALDIPAPVLFGADAMLGTGERASLLTDIHRTLSRMNDDQLDRAAKMLKAFVGYRGLGGRLEGRRMRQRPPHHPYMPNPCASGALEGR
ncbi:hypothetical protein [Thauera sp. SDU_THAU2]|uniref:hypothetical protein n=1 Tax=Thauera sp. SDU_THAU2 TaxID=3136633 RepID=UPI0031203151